MVKRGVGLDLILDPQLHFGRELVVYVHAHHEVHEVDRLIDRFQPWWPGPDEFRNLLEA